VFWNQRKEPFFQKKNELSKENFQEDLSRS